MKTILFLIVAAASGCASYTETQLRLLEQARNGIDLTRQHQAERGKLVEALQESQRGRADAAFDADVRQRDSLDADWVIEHRKAYALLLDAIARQKQSAREADAAAKDNLDAVDSALERIQMLQQLQLRLWKLQLPPGQ